MYHHRVCLHFRLTYFAASILLTPYPNITFQIRHKTNLLSALLKPNRIKTRTPHPAGCLQRGSEGAFSGAV